jgi:hypothetical protein
MKRLLGALLALTLLGWTASAALSHEEHGAMKEGSEHSMTVTGEIVDTGCYLSHAATGAKHKQCAATCVARGMPIGLVTDKGDLYLLVQPHGNLDAYKKARTFAGDRVEITGPMYERSGMKAIEVAMVKAAPAAQASH